MHPNEYVYYFGW